MMRVGLGAPGKSIRLTTPRTPGTLRANSSACRRASNDATVPARCTTLLTTPTRSVALSPLVDSRNRTAARRISSGSGDKSGSIYPQSESLEFGFILGVWGTFWYDFYRRARNHITLNNQQTQNDRPHDQACGHRLDTPGATLTPKSRLKKGHEEGGRADGY